jgi:hypothetical protein
VAQRARAPVRAPPTSAEPTSPKLTERLSRMTLTMAPSWKLGGMGPRKPPWPSARRSSMRR